MAEDRRILRALHIIQSTQPVRPEAIARLLNLSISRFRHLFKKETGISVGRFQKQLQLTRAKELLRTSDLSVKEITAIIGIGDVSHFSRDYKALHKQTPSQTRESSDRIRSGPTQ